MTTYRKAPLPLVDSAPRPAPAAPPLPAPPRVAKRPPWRRRDEPRLNFTGIEWPPLPADRKSR